MAQGALYGYRDNLPQRASSLPKPSNMSNSYKADDDKKRQTHHEIVGQAIDLLINSSPTLIGQFLIFYRRRCKSRTAASLQKLC
jgi:hypothetical protein